MVLSDTLFLLPSEDINNTLVLKGELVINYLSECIAHVKNELDNLLAPQFNLSMLSESREINSIVIRLDGMYPFICDARDLDGRILKSVKKRKILEPLSMKFSTKDYLQFDKLEKTFKIFSDISFEGKEAFFTISYQDIVSLANAFIYNMKMLEKEYFARMMKLNKVKARNPGRVIEEEFDYLISLNSDIENSFGSQIRSSAYMSSSMDDTIIIVLNKAIKAMEQLKKASDEVTQYKNRAAQYKRKTFSSERRITDIKAFPNLRHSGFLDVNRPKEDFLTPRSFIKERNVPSMSSRDYFEKDSELVYERLHSTTQLYFESIKIVFFKYISNSFLLMTTKVYFIQY